MNNNFYYIVSIALCAMIFIFLFMSNKGSAIMLEKITTIEQVKSLFTRSAEQLESKAKKLLADAQQALEVLIKIPDSDRTYDNTVRALDMLTAQFSSVTSIIQATYMVHPEASIRNKAQSLIIEVQNFAIEQFSSNKKLYESCKAYYEGNFKKEKELLSEEEIYYLEKLMLDFKKAGLELSDAELARLKDIKKDLAVLEVQFETNINGDTRTITVTRQELEGVPQVFVDSLQQDSAGNYILRPDYPTRDQIMKQCVVEKTREKFWYMFNNRGYPANEEILKKVIVLRDRMARMLGYESYAHLDCDDTMAHSLHTIHQFLDTLIDRSEKKLEQEIAGFKAHLPQGITLFHGAFKPWDIDFIKDNYKQKFYDIDEAKLAEYFPMEFTVKGLLSIYEKFFDIRFKSAELQGMWHNEVQGLEVQRIDGSLIGYLLLDLHPREFKYTHACQITISPTITTKTGEYYPAVALVLANFPKSTPTTPSLLMRNDVITFFHEFGHAIHSLLGSTRMAGFSGTSVKMDFVEMPSQMLEEWMWDKQMIKMVSSHYKTQEPLDDVTIERLQSLKNYDSADFLRRQLIFGKLSLAYFAPGEDKDITGLKRTITKNLRSHVAQMEDEHFEASFGHLMGYGAKYYGYLWSKVYALDLFATIKKGGLLNPIVGTAYRLQVIGKGGSREPMELLRDFLGREPQTDAFFEDMGLS